MALGLTERKNLKQKEPVHKVVNHMGREQQFNCRSAASVMEHDKGSLRKKGRTENHKTVIHKGSARIPSKHQTQSAANKRRSEEELWCVPLHSKPCKETIHAAQVHRRSHMTSQHIMNNYFLPLHHVLLHIAFVFEMCSKHNVFIFTFM